MHVTMRGATFVRAKREAVWAALHDIDVIAHCVPGCRSLARTSKSLFVLSTRIAIGPLRITMQGTVEIAESDPPRSYSLVGYGTGGAMNASGVVRITLTEQHGGCRLHYAIEADARGPLSAAGPAVVSGIGKGVTAYFATRFGGLVEQEQSRSGTERSCITLV